MGNLSFVRIIRAREKNNGGSRLGSLESTTVLPLPTRARFERGQGSPSSLSRGGPSPWGAWDGHTVGARAMSCRYGEQIRALVLSCVSLWTET